MLDRGTVSFTRQDPKQRAPTGRAIIAQDASPGGGAIKGNEPQRGALSCRRTAWPAQGVGGLARPVRGFLIWSAMGAPGRVALGYAGAARWAWDATASNAGSKCSNATRTARLRQCTSSVRLGDGGFSDRAGLADRWLIRDRSRGLDRRRTAEPQNDESQIGQGRTRTATPPWGRQGKRSQAAARISRGDTETAGQKSKIIALFSSAGVPGELARRHSPLRDGTASPSSRPAPLRDLRGSVRDFFGRAGR